MKPFFSVTDRAYQTQHSVGAVGDREWLDEQLNGILNDEPRLLRRQP